MRYFPVRKILILIALAGACAPEEEQPPTPVYGPSPFHYPLALWDRGIEGATLLQVHVNDSGDVDSTIVRQSSGYAEFDSAASAGARDLQFRPARRGTRAIDAWVHVPVRFSRSTDPAVQSPQRVDR